jgi:anti-anti-sigma regulatory factor
VREQTDFVLDLRQLEFLDSQGVRMLNVLALRLGELDRKLEVVIESTSPVSALLRITPVRNAVVAHR